MSIRILEKREVEQNSFYNSEKTNDGGGYHQPYRETFFEYEGETYRFVLDSSSCGDFGLRYTKTLYKHDEVLAESNINEVDAPEVWDGRFSHKNPLHIELLEMGFLKLRDFMDDGE